MSTEFNPATFEHEGVVCDAKYAPDPDSCNGCFFQPGLRRIDKSCTLCEPHDRPDGKTIIWVVRAQEGKKA